MSTRLRETWAWALKLLLELGRAASTHLEAPIERVTGYDIPYPPSKLEEHYLPDHDRILVAVDSVDGGLNVPIEIFHLPDAGEGLTEAEIVRWLVEPGDSVSVNQMVVEIETAKATVELPIPWAAVSLGNPRRNWRDCSLSALG